MLRSIANSNYTLSIVYVSCHGRQRVALLLFGPHITAQRLNSTIPFRKQLKDEARLKKAQKGSLENKASDSSDASNWKLTVGIEIHAQLNSSRKLFSGKLLASNLDRADHVKEAPTLLSDEPNKQTALFDLAVPGSQPILQKAVLLPALRAALALNCDIQRQSRFDRKHYFYHDQPAGYQITQYYSPLAKDGHISLTPADDIAVQDGSTLKIGIKQIQLEQDTAKTVQQPPDDVLLDFNRVGHPLIEIITLPHIHSPQTAAACVRKIQEILESVNAVTTGMESGGLRADVNISVQRVSDTGKHSYAGVQGLGQRTEIKNLSSFKAVEDAIIAERDRQIKVLETGGNIEGETRGWTLGSTETRKLRGKEGEVDYRYMPDPDIPPLLLSQGLIDHLKNNLPMLPDEQTEFLTTNYGISAIDAKALVVLDRGLRIDYLADVLHSLDESGLDSRKLGKIASNWILHELGGLLSTHNIPFDRTPVSPRSLAGILENLSTGKINGQGAKTLLSIVFAGDERNIADLIAEQNLGIEAIDADAYTTLAAKLLEQNPNQAKEIQNGKTGKLQWFVGQMMRTSQGKMDPKQALETLSRLLKA